MARSPQLDLPLNGGGRRSRKDDSSGGGRPPSTPPPVPDASLADEAQRRYLNYALSVITSRALPDVRDGLKPVQRRILYAMLNDLHLSPDAKFRKSAAIVGDVMGKYHPHGDTAIYDAMVRLAQDFVMRTPLVSGHGNFGSVDGDAAAAMRYTEAKLRAPAMELLGELGKRTVEWRPNYDGTRSEPVVLPARFPHLLVNGSQGIAVGMATSIPPHNMGEVIDACIALIEAREEARELTTFRLLTHVKGPDFPTGGQIHATKSELEAIYTTGQGSLKLRGEWRSEGGDSDGKRAVAPPMIIVTSIPYAIERKSIVEKIAEVILSKKLPSLVDVRDESTEETRIVMELKKGSDPQLVMAYLYKNTPLAVNVQVNLTCLVPTNNPDVAAPKRLGLQEILNHFIDFRYATVTRRTEFDLEELNRRIHVLEGLETIFDVVDEVVRIIRKSEGKADAAQRIMARFQLSEEQTDAILELKLYRLARLEILVIRRELGEKRAEAKRLEALLKSKTKRMALVKDELGDIKTKFADRRKTKIMGSVDEPEFQAEDFIVAEDVSVILSAQGWLKRVREVKDLSSTRLRDGDSVLAAVAGSTRSAVACFSNLGACYVCRIHDVPASTGYGDPVQKLFKLGDGERMIAMLSFDPRAIDVPAPSDGATEPEPPFALAVTRGGLGFRFSLRPHRDPSTRAGRRYAKLNEGDEVLAVMPCGRAEAVLCASTDGYALGVSLDEIATLSGTGKGSILMKVEGSERLVGATLAMTDDDVLIVETEKGIERSLPARKIMGARAARGRQSDFKKDRFARVVLPPPAVQSLETMGGPSGHAGLSPHTPRVS